MITAIHQPQYLPWLGYFDKIHQADLFILLDNVQFKKNEWQNRNRIRTSQGPQWLTVPVLHHFGQTISEVQINQKIPWARNHLKALELNYCKAPHYDSIMPLFKDVFDRPWENLAEINIHLIRLIADYLGITTKIVLASEYVTTNTSTARLIELCVHTGTEVYLAGADGKNYMDLTLFENREIEVRTQDYCHPEYPQTRFKNNQDFSSHLSIVDLLFNCGSQSLSTITALNQPVQAVSTV